MDRNDTGMSAILKTAQIAEYIRQYFEVYGKAPTYREIGHAFQMSSKGSVWQHVNKLEKSGFLIRTKGYKRVIRLT